jgi:cyclin-dependent kinase 14
VEESSTRASKLPYNGYSDEFLDRLEPNGNIPTDKDMRYGKGIFIRNSVILTAS